MRNKSTAITHENHVTLQYSTSETIAWKVSIKAALLYLCLLACEWLSGSTFTKWCIIRMTIQAKPIGFICLHLAQLPASKRGQKWTLGNRTGREGSKHTLILPKIFYQFPDWTDPRTRPGTRVLALQTSCAMSGLSLNSRTMILCKNKKDPSGSLWHNDQLCRKAKTAGHIKCFHTLANLSIHQSGRKTVILGGTYHLHRASS